MVDFALQRLNMVESQVRPSDLTDRRITNAMTRVPREAYLPASLQGVAYSDRELPLSGIEGANADRECLAPRTIARMIQELVINEHDIVLLVGAGCGYEAALLSHLAQTVVGTESDAALAQWAETALTGQDVSNAVIVQAALRDGYPSEGPYDAILINGGIDRIDEGLLDQLKDGGRLVAILRRGGVCRLTLWRRVGEHFSSVEHAIATANVLPSFDTKATFEF
ncbi:MAG: protein-L-isoaspartate O-methyltransferase [Alphaproteobacteria bacterium]|nr:protein-L-isoaspartate O-methyltransferase [Alphaproteobacteria bacterium]